MYDTHFDPEKQICRKHFSVGKGGNLNVKIRWSKTIQFKDRAFVITLPNMPAHALDPVSAIVKALKFRVHADPDSQALPIRTAVFNSRLKALAGHEFSSHSFRRGAATFALSAGIPETIIRLWGDWKSDAYCKYVDQVPSSVLENYKHVFANKIPN